uniref:Bm8498 n=1 Tax=Brugia malayi TaxID=6279 RepID=A0A1I9G6H7_BRUMA|nr:Bm8498 [Brugia malayi]
MVNSGRRKEKLEKKVGGRRADFNMERVEKKIYEIFVMDSIDLQESNEIMRCAVLWCGARCGAVRCGVMRYGAVRHNSERSVVWYGEGDSLVVIDASCFLLLGLILILDVTYICISFFFKTSSK